MCKFLVCNVEGHDVRCSNLRYKNVLVHLRCENIGFHFRNRGTSSLFNNRCIKGFISSKFCNIRAEKNLGHFVSS